MKVLGCIVGTIAMAALLGCDYHHSYPDVAALVDIRHIQEAERQFMLEHARFANLSELALASPVLVDRELAEGHKHGYRFVLTVSESRFAIQTEPIEWGRTGFRSFYSD